MPNHEFMPNHEPLSNHEPMRLSDTEWREVIAMPRVREAWGIADDVSVDDFKSQVYGVKFDYITGGPGYFGDIYIIQDDSLEPPLAFVRQNGALKLLVR
jgi:hypothetical protein